MNAALPDDGYFPRGSSVLRMVHEEKAVGLMYGQRALCVGAVKPLNYVGTSEHTHNKRTPFRRIAHTGGMFEAVFFGPKARADRALTAVEMMHERVVGELSEDAGPGYPAGTPYSAFDPELMLWTVAVIADSAEWFYERLVRPLRPATSRLSAAAKRVQPSDASRRRASPIPGRRSSTSPVSAM